MPSKRERERVGDSVDRMRARTQMSTVRNRDRQAERKKLLD